MTTHACKMADFYLNELKEAAPKYDSAFSKCITSGEKCRKNKQCS